GQHKLHTLKSSDRVTKLLTFARIITGDFKGGLRYANSYRADIDTSPIQGREGDFETLALGAEQIIRRQLAVLKDQFPGGRRVQAHLALGLAKRKARNAFFNHETG